MKPKKTMLIFGVSSFIGSNLADKFKNDYKIVGTFFNTKVSADQFLTLRCDITNSSLVKGIINLVQPDVVLYCVGKQDVYSCHEEPRESDSLNTNGVFNVINSLDSFNAKFIYFSSALAFSGGDSTHLDDDAPVPNTTYGSSVASSEFYIQKSYLNYVTLRVSNVFGISLNSNRLNDFERIQSCILEKREESFDDNALYSFLSVIELGNIVKKVLDEKVTNVTLNIAGNELGSIYDFAKTYCDVFGESNVFVKKGTRPFPVINTISNQNLRNGKFVFSLDDEKAKSLLKLRMYSIKDSLIEYRTLLEGKKKVKKIKLQLI